MYRDLRYIAQKIYRYIFVSMQKLCLEEFLSNTEEFSSVHYLLAGIFRKFIINQSAEVWGGQSERDLYTGNVLK